LEIWIWKAKKSGLVGRPPDPDFWKKVKKSALKKSGLAKSGIWNDFFSLKKVKKTRKLNYGRHPVLKVESVLKRFSREVFFQNKNDTYLNLGNNKPIGAKFKTGK
jgi:hypothetical protein